ncbi:MAG: 3-hydroxyacyl-CoA dehydrogenase NAD-binding domain-containing protein [Chitinophagaceae bacterium]|nr:3-hydroxyacyl-CoA dehydrogenase NAD-binding domain-containing protein [Chitinophagaceae bacterium]
MDSKVETIVVCGAGTMGSGIAQMAAMAGYRTLLYDVQPDMLQKGRQTLEKNLQFLVDKAKLTAADYDALWQRIDITGNLEACRGDLIIEAIVEKMDVKLALFNELFKHNSSTTLFASNTSSLSITALQQGLPDAGRVAGMHFFNPAHIMKLVEVVKGQYTSEHTAATIYTVAQQMGKVPVYCKDAPGFIVNHVARTYYLEAMHLVEMGYASIETVDACMEAAGFKMGPFKLMDLIGMDVNYKVSEQVWQALGKPDRLQPAAMQHAKVTAGELGRKTGKGFYQY